MFKFSKIVSAVALAVAGVAANAGAVIDDFNVPNVDAGVTVEVGQPGAWVTQAGAGILGGERDLYVEALSGDAGDTARIRVANGRLSLTTENVVGLGIVRWDGANTGTSIDSDGLVGLGAIATDAADLSIGAIGIRLTVVSADANFPIEFEVWTDDANDGTYVKHTKTMNAPGGPGTVDFIFTDIVGANFADVGALQFKLNGVATALDISIDIIQAVPEPGSLALAGLALAGLGMARRRKVAAK